QVHTSRYSPCSIISPVQAILVARSVGLDGIALTEHTGGWASEEIEDLKAAAGCREFVVLVGYEIRTRSEERPTGDLLVFGVEKRPTEPCSIDELCREVHKQGGVVIAAHPFAGLQGIGDEVHSSWIDAIEVYNFRYHSPSKCRRAEEAQRQIGITGVGSSDAHVPEEIGQFCTELEMPIRSERDLVAAILAGRCRPRPKRPPSRLWRILQH
ncbi:PHP domain-containing protein, partial [Candidatus Sumerlaeota bacterium]|nr:PHP domain-containing protein [Candidatus Sumerlaeota bacterium]